MSITFTFIINVWKYVNEETRLRKVAKCPLWSWLWKVQCHKIFSTAGILLNKFWSHLSSSVVDQIGFFLNKNLKPDTDIKEIKYVVDMIKHSGIWHYKNWKFWIVKHSYLHVVVFFICSHMITYSLLQLHSSNCVIMCMPVVILKRTKN